LDEIFNHHFEKEEDVKKIKTISLIIILILMLACGSMPTDNSDSSGNSSSNDDGNNTAREDAAAKTVSAYQTENASGSDPLPLDPTATVPPGEPTYTPLPTYTSFPTHTPLPTLTATASKPCNKAGFVSETIPDNTEFTPNETFTKKWTIRNDGSCTWTSGYKWYFASGDQMNAPNSVTLTSGTVPPGGTVTVKVDMKAPASPGTYKGTWKIKDGEGTSFTPNGFWVQIKVVAATSFTVTFENIHSCGGFYAFMVKLKNNGTNSFQSIEQTVENITTSTVIITAASNQPFMDDPNGCSWLYSDIEPGDIFYTGINIGPAVPPSGHKLRYTITMCTQNNLLGDCVTKTFKYTIP
jgi:hypothetical protein